MMLDNNDISDFFSLVFHKVKSRKTLGIEWTVISKVHILEQVSNSSDSFTNSVASSYESTFFNKNKCCYIH